MPLFFRKDIFFKAAYAKSFCKWFFFPTYVHKHMQETNKCSIHGLYHRSRCCSVHVAFRQNWCCICTTTGTERTARWISQARKTTAVAPTERLFSESEKCRQWSWMHQNHNHGNNMKKNWKEFKEATRKVENWNKNRRKALKFKRKLQKRAN